MGGYGSSTLYPSSDRRKTSQPAIAIMNDARRTNPEEEERVTSLFPCTSMWGQDHVFHYAPKLLPVFHAVFSDGALYDRHRRIIMAGAYCRGVPDLSIFSEWGGKRQSYFSLYDFENGRAETYHEPCLWVGPLFPQYGHFLVSSLARLWATLRPECQGLPILHAGSHYVPALFHGEPYIKAIFDGLGKTVSDLVAFEERTIISSVIVPEPLFEENHFALAGFAAFCTDLGNRLLSKERLSPIISAKPMYISKSRLPGGVSHIVNEEEIEHFLEDRGVDIFRPELCSLPEQIATWRGRSTIAGFLGSGFHTSLFAGGKNILGLSYGSQIGSNQLLIDKICGNCSEYIYPAGSISIDRSGADPRFQYTAMLDNPTAVAEQILRRLEQSERWASIGKRALIGTPSACLIALTDDPLGSNLSPHFHANQSSVLEACLATAEAAACLALSPDVTEINLSSTMAEVGAWWSAVARDDIYVHEVRIFGSCRSVTGEAHVSLLTVDKSGREFVASSGSLEATTTTPFRWRPSIPTIMRGISIRSAEEAVLLIERVEIYGEWIRSSPPPPS